MTCSRSFTHAILTALTDRIETVALPSDQNANQMFPQVVNK
jgi:hypothetical protein